MSHFVFLVHHFSFSICFSVFSFFLFIRRLSCGFVVNFFLCYSSISLYLYLSSYLFWWFFFPTKWVYVSVIIIIVIYREYYCVLKFSRKVEDYVYEEPSPRPHQIRYNMSKRYLFLNQFFFFYKCNFSPHIRSQQS